MRTSKAAARLQESPVSPCASCGRDTRTVQGVCADCWAPKDGRVPLHATKPRTERLLDFDWDDPYVLTPVAAVVLSVCVAALWKVLA